MKRSVLLIVLMILLTACSNEEHVTPNERFQEFASLWMEQRFEEMYDYFSSETKENISEEDSIERYEKIYSDLNIDDIQIDFEPLSEEELDALTEAKEEEEIPSVTIPFSVSMESFAGPIEFEHEAVLVQEPVDMEDDEEVTLSWFVEWNPGFIHPELEDGGEIGIQTVEPLRGEILDRNQMPLAINDKVYQIGIVPENLQNREQAIQEIATILNIRTETIEEALDEPWVQDDLFVPIATILPSDEDVYNRLMAIPGVQRMEVMGRIYPGGEATAHLIGYIGDITAEFLEKADNHEYGPNDKVGRRGLEQLYEERLRGKKGVKVFIRKENGDEVTIAEKPVQNGETIQLTIDINIQEKIYESYGDDAGTTAAIDPKTGETLALVSAPAFDPNDILYGTSSDLWQRLEEDEQQPLINRFAATYAPGSVLKPITAVAGINAGTLDPEEELEIKGKYWGKESWGGYEVSRLTLSDGPVDLEDALVRSDNIYFAMQAVDMGGNAFVEQLERFGFGEEPYLPYEYPVTMSSISNSGDLDDEILLANTSYGQGEIEMSALHLAASYTIFVNEGNMVKPTLLLDEPTGEVWEENLLSKEEAERIDEILRKVVTDGTAQLAEEEANVPLAGKTGTAELKLSRDSEGSVNSWFIAYPHESQDILMAMMIEKTEDKEMSYAVEKFVEVINKLYPDEE